MVFGKGKQKVQEQSYQNNDQGIAQAFNNNLNNDLPLQNPINVPNIYQPSISAPVNPIQQVNQQVQNQSINQVQRIQKQARIIKGEVNEEGEYYYIVVTNYPLRIDDCNLEN